MCNPAIAVMGMSAATTALSSWQKTQSQMKQQQDAASLTAQQAAQARQKTDFQAGQQRLEARKNLAKLRVRQAASGGTLDNATNMAVAAEQAARQELDALVTEWRGDQEAFAAEEQTRRLQQKTQETQRSGLLNIAGGLVQTIPQMTGQKTQKGSW